MTDMAENALTVNALQRHATVVTQKSRSEGFGLTVAEAMWNRTPVVATAVGGIQLQIPSPAHGVTAPVAPEGDQFGAAVRMLLEDRDKTSTSGRAGTRTHSHAFSARHPTRGRDQIFRKSSEMAMVKTHTETGGTI